MIYDNITCCIFVICHLCFFIYLKLIGVSRMKESLNKGDDDDIVDFFEISYQNLCLIHTYKA